MKTFNEINVRFATQHLVLKKNNMKNLGIICGGFSSEFEISVKSATNISNNFPNGFRVFLIELNKEIGRAHV